MNWKLKARIVDTYGRQWRFAQALGIQPSLVSRVITGEKELPADEQVQWAAALKTSTSIFKREAALD